MVTFIETNDGKFVLQVKQFNDNVDEVKVLLGLNQDKLDQLVVDQGNFKYVLDGLPTYEQYEKSVLSKKKSLRHSKDQTVLISLVQPAQWPSTILVNMPAGIQSHFEEIIQDCMNSTKMTHEIGVTLGFMKAIVPFVPGDGTPDAEGKVAGGGSPHLECVIGEYSGYAVYKDSGAGYGTSKYDSSNYHDYIDVKQAIPAKNVTQVLKYKLKFIYQGAEVGNFSNEVTVVLLGVI